MSFFQFGGQEFTEANALTIALASIAVIVAFYAVAKTCEKFMNNKREHIVNNDAITPNFSSVTSFALSNAPVDSAGSIHNSTENKNSLDADTLMAAQGAKWVQAPTVHHMTPNRPVERLSVQPPVDRTAQYLATLGNHGFRNSRETFATCPDGRDVKSFTECMGDNDLGHAINDTDPRKLKIGPNGLPFDHHFRNNREGFKIGPDGMPMKEGMAALPSNVFNANQFQNTVTSAGVTGVSDHPNPFLGNGYGGAAPSFRSNRTRFYENFEDNLGILANNASNDAASVRSSPTAVGSAVTKVMSSVDGIPAKTPSATRYLRLVPQNVDQASDAELPYLGVDSEGLPILDTTNAYQRDLVFVIQYGPDEISPDNLPVLKAIEKALKGSPTRKPEIIKLTDGAYDYYLKTLADWAKFKYNVMDENGNDEHEALIQSFIPNARKQGAMSQQVTNDLSRYAEVTTSRSRSGRAGRF